MIRTSMRIQKKKIVLAVAGMLGATLGSTAWAVDTDTAVQQVTLNVQSVNLISVGAASVTFNVGSTTAGASLTGTGTSTYAISTNDTTNKKITAQLDASLGTGLTLAVFLQAPSTGTSVGSSNSPVTLGSGSASSVVTGIGAVTASGLTITYTATATAAVTTGNHAANVTYTITADS